MLYLTVYTGNKLPPFYIGYSYNVKERNYYGSPSSKLYKDIFIKERKENPDKFKIFILKEFGNDIHAAKEYETYLQKTFKVDKNPLYFNRCIQGVNYHSVPCNEENKRKLSKMYKNKSYEEIYGKDRAKTEAKKRSDSNKGKIRSNEYKKKMSLSKTGYKHTEEAKRKISKSNVYRGIGFFTGKKHTEEAKRKIANASRERIASDETRRKISESLTGKTLSDEHKQKISQNNGKAGTNKVSCVDKNGKKILIDSETFWKEKDKPINERLYVGITSKEARKRIKDNE
jgi:hypothetical protein